jgi:nucleoporin SEH1
MTLSSRIHTGHKDLIHDFVYDFYGKRLATCSSDQTIKIWKKSHQGWQMDQDLKHRHSGSIQRLCWAHPKFGDIIATCASDYNVHLFVSTGSEFSFKTQLSKPKDIVRDVQFAPEHYETFSLSIGAASADGTIRIWESQDITDLQQWACRHTIPVGGQANCLSWCPAKFGPRTLAVGTTEGAHIWCYDEKSKEFKQSHQLILDVDTISIHWAPNLGRRYHMIALGARHPKEPLRVAKIQDGKNKIQIFELIDEEGQDQATIWRICWNMTGTLLAASMDNGKTLVWKFTHEREDWSIVQRY